MALYTKRSIFVVLLHWLLDLSNSDAVYTCSCYKIAIKNGKHSFQDIWWDRFETGLAPGAYAILLS